MKLIKTLLITGLTTLSISAFAGETIEQAPATTPEAQLNVQADAQALQDATIVSTQDALAQGTAPTEEHLNQAADAKASDKAGDKVALEEEQDKKDKQ